MHQKGGIGLAVLEAFRKLLLAVLGIELWLMVLLLVHTVGYDKQASTHNK